MSVMSLRSMLLQVAPNGYEKIGTLVTHTGYDVEQERRRQLLRGTAYVAAHQAVVCAGGYKQCMGLARVFHTSRRTLDLHRRS